MAEPLHTSHETTDIKGNPITILSLDGKPKSDAEFAAALDRYDKGERTQGFHVMPAASFGGLRRKLERTASYIPDIGEAVGGFAGTSPLALLLQKAGLISPETAGASIQAGRDVGRSIGEYVKGQVDTPERLGSTIGTSIATGGLPLPVIAGGKLLASTAGFMKPVMTGTGAWAKLPFIGNMLKAGVAGGGGAVAGGMLFGEPFDPGKAITEFTIAAASAVPQNIVSFWLSRYVTPHSQEKFAKKIVDTLTDRHPQMKGNPDLVNLGMNSVQDLERMSQVMSSGLRESIDETASTLSAQIRSIAPRGMTASEIAMLRERITALVNAQNNTLNKTLSPDLYREAGKTITAAEDELRQFLTGLGAKAGGKPMVGLERVISDASNEFARLRQGAEVLGHLKESATGGKLNLMEFAQRIRGEYMSGRNPLLERIGTILGGGRPIQQMPLPREREAGGELTRVGYNMFKERLPFGLGHLLPSTGYSGPQVPWAGPQKSPVPGILGFGIQQEGKDAIRSYVEKPASRR